MGRLILAKRDDGKYAATIGGTGMSIPRQVGKTFLVGSIVFALCLLRPNLTVIWTSHRLRTANETFSKMRGFAKRKQIKPHVLKPILGSGEEEIPFRNGSRILFGARERGFGRGFDEVDVLIFDEAQILSERALDDMIPATNQSRQASGALVLFMGTPPKPEDPGEVFGRMRAEALAGEDSDTGWVEFGADPDFLPTALPAPLKKRDWDQVAKANPSYPKDTPRESILRMRKRLGPESFLREGLGIWDVVTGDGIVSAAEWANVKDESSHIVGKPAFAIDMTPDRTRTAIAVAGRREDGRFHVEIVEHRGGSDWVADRVEELKRKWRPVDVAMSAQSAAMSLLPELRDRKIEPTVFTGGQFTQACGGFYDKVKQDQLRHLGDPVMAQALQGATWRDVGGAKAFDWKNSTSDICPLVAGALAIHALALKPFVKAWAGRS